MGQVLRNSVFGGFFLILWHDRLERNWSWTLFATRWCCRSMPRALRACQTGCLVAPRAGRLLLDSYFVVPVDIPRVSAFTLKASANVFLDWAPSDTHRMASCTCWTAISELNLSLSAFRTARTDLTWSSPAKRECTTKCWRVRRQLRTLVISASRGSVWEFDRVLVCPQTWTPERRRATSQSTSSTWTFRTTTRRPRWVPFSSASSVNVWVTMARILNVCD